jgi:internalin A
VDRAGPVPAGLRAVRCQLGRYAVQFSGIIYFKNIRGLKGKSREYTHAEIHMPLQRDQIFISYSRADREWLNRLQVMLVPLVRAGRIHIWDDTRIEPGTRWREEISEALASARVAVLLVTPEFLASEFISRDELPVILEATRRDGLKLIWIAVKASLYQKTELVGYQAVNDPSRPLDTLTSAELGAELVRIAEAIDRAANP